jgi:peroxiredoxin
MHVRSPRVGLLSICVLWLGVSAVQAQVRVPVSFAEPPSRELEMRPFTDAQIDDLLTTFASVIKASTPDDPSSDPDLNLWKFMRWLQTGVMTPAQETRVLHDLTLAAESRPDLAPQLEREARAVRTLTIGKVAPEIAGPDLEGTSFRLSDYRGKVVVLAFTGEWCAICRSEYPYQRLLQELYQDWPFAMLGVNSDTSVEAARTAKIARNLNYRSWWEKKSDKADGRIASAYDLYGWPTVYVLDDEGVIRFVDVRQEDLLKAVRQLVMEVERKTEQVQPSR